MDFRYFSTPPLFCAWLPFFQFLSYFFFLFLSDHITHAIMRYSSTSRDDSLIKSRALIIPWDEERIHILNARWTRGRFWRERKKNLWCCVRGFLMRIMISRQIIIRYKMKKRLLLRKEWRGRERTNTSAMFVRRCFDIHPVWPNTCVRIRKRNRTNAMFARRGIVTLKV